MAATRATEAAPRRGIRLAAPLSSAVHLGARRILAMSTGYQRTPDEAAAA